MPNPRECNRELEHKKCIANGLLLGGVYLAVLQDLVDDEDLGALGEEEAVARLRAVLEAGPVLVLMENADQVLEGVGEC